MRRVRRIVAQIVVLSVGIVTVSSLSGLRPAGAAPGFYGSMGGTRINEPVVSMVGTASGAGYYLFARDGGVFAFGDAPFRGSLGSVRLNAPIVDGALSANGNGYSLAASDGGVFSFGTPFHGSLGGLRLVAPIVGFDAAADGSGYVMVSADGGVFAFGSVAFRGSAAGQIGFTRAVGIALRPQGDGYWVALADGRVLAFGGAATFGNLSRIAAPIVAIEAAPDGAGYLLVGSDGGAFAFGSTPFHGSAGGARLNAPMVDVALTGDGYWMLGADGGVFTFPGAAFPGAAVPGAAVPATGTPNLAAEPVATGLTIPWDLGFLPSGAMVFTERPGRIRALVGGQLRLLANVSPINATGEGGLTGLAIDPAFASNGRIYTCHNASTSEVRVSVWTLDAAVTAATPVGTLVGGLPAISSGRHSGCRPRVGPDGFLWVGTGDAATGTNPQNVNSLGGKVLRVDRFSGLAAPGNPGGQRWYTLGHRNVQGLAFRPASGVPYSAEHGPDRDDELNLLTAGANYGWDPVPGYNESVPMTRAGATPAVWTSGPSTIATSGITFLDGPQWLDWNGRIAVANLAGQHLRILELNAPGTAVVSEAAVLTTFGRLRTPVQGPDGSLYVTTSNGGGTDQILRVSPS
jgi:glucose/arabinose dehydrogenase